MTMYKCLERFLSYPPLIKFSFSSELLYDKQFYTSTNFIPPICRGEVTPPLLTDDIQANVPIVNVMDILATAIMESYESTIK